MVTIPQRFHPTTTPGGGRSITEGGHSRLEASATRLVRRSTSAGETMNHTGRREFQCGTPAGECILDNTGTQGRTKHDLQDSEDLRDYTDAGRSDEIRGSKK